MKLTRKGGGASRAKNHPAERRGVLGEGGGGVWLLSDSQNLQFKQEKEEWRGGDAKK